MQIRDDQSRVCDCRVDIFSSPQEITPRKQQKSLFRILIKREILTCREVLYTKLVRVISSCFAMNQLCCSLWTSHFFYLRILAA